MYIWTRYYGLSMNLTNEIVHKLNNCSLNKDGHGRLPWILSNSGLETPYTRAQPISVHDQVVASHTRSPKLNQLIIHVHSLLPDSRSKQRHLLKNREITKVKTEPRLRHKYHGPDGVCIVARVLKAHALTNAMPTTMDIALIRTHTAGHDVTWHYIYRASPSGHLITIGWGQSQ